VCCGIAAATSCQKNEYGTVDLSYNHPCALYSAADFARVKAAIAAGTLNSRSGLPCRQTDM